jgi:hypothetical protein
MQDSHETLIDALGASQQVGQTRLCVTQDSRETLIDALGTLVKRGCAIRRNSSF